MKFVRQSDYIKYNDDYNLTNRAFEFAMGEELFRQEVLAQAAPQWNPRLVKSE